MISRNRFTAAALSLVLLMASPVSSAIKLGDLQGAALIGRTLDVSVQVQAVPGEDASASCFAADVYYAEAQQRAPQISMGAVSTAPESTAVVRIQLDEPVTETFVTVLLTSRCGSTSSRRYVLLADIPQAAAATPVPALIVLPVRAAQPVAQAASSTATAQRQAEPVARKPRASAPVNADKPVKKSVTKAAPGKPAQVKQGDIGKARLKLDAMAFLSDRMDSLDSPMVFAPTEDTLLHAKQIAGLETDLKNLRKQAASSELRLLDLQTQLQLAQSQQVPLWMIYAGAAVLLLSLLALAWVWQRQRQLSAAKNDWWQDPDKEDEPSTVLASRAPDTRQDGFTHTVQAAPTIVLKQAPAGVATVSSVPEAAPAVDLDITTGSFMLSSTKRASEQADASRSTKGHHLMAEDVLDIRQQADFFVSLGQTERALDILCKQISQATDPNPLLHLDLIALYHALGMKSDFYEQREVFARHFNGTIPEFADFTHESRSLEGYPEVLAELTRLWPNVQAFAYVDACIYRDENVQSESFDLAAFRDLLTLHALAEVVATETTLLPAKATAPVKPKKKALSIPAIDVASSVVPPPPIKVTVPPVELPTETSGAAIHLVSDEELLSSLPSAFANFELPPVPVIAPVSAPAPEPQSEAETKCGLPNLNESAAGTFDHSLNVLAADAESEMPTRMLDLDFSNLESVKIAAPSAEPAPSAATARYATRSRWPVSKKPGTSE